MKAIAILAGVVVLGAIFWLVIQNQNSATNTNISLNTPPNDQPSSMSYDTVSPTAVTSSPVSTTPMVTTAVPVITSSQATSNLVIKLGEVNSSKQSGTATFSEANGKVTVKIMLTGTPANSDEPAHIHTGQCPDVGDIKYPLNNVKNGQSTTQLNTTLAKIQSELPLGLNVHASASDLKNYTACGDLSF
jgi:hypothetical protein